MPLSLKRVKNIYVNLNSNIYEHTSIYECLFNKQGCVVLDGATQTENILSFYLSFVCERYVTGMWCQRF